MLGILFVTSFCSYCWIVCSLAMAWESSLVTHCLVKNSIFYLTFNMWASQLLGLFSEDLTLADDWVLDRDRAVGYHWQIHLICMRGTKHWMCRQAGIFSSSSGCIWLSCRLVWCFGFWHSPYPLIVVWGHWYIFTKFSGFV